MAEMVNGVASYCDHVGLWRDELRRWVPRRLFDAHVHLHPPAAMGPLSPERLREALGTFTSLEWETCVALYGQLFSGKEIAGLFAFPLPLREARQIAANDYLIEIMKRDRRVHGFFLAHPTDPRPSIAAYERSLATGVPFVGAKPYSDLIGKNNFKCVMTEFIPEGLLEFMEAKKLILMLHTSGMGVGDAEVRRYLRWMAGRFPSVKVVLAHMGRYVRAEQFFDFLDSGLLEEFPNFFLDISSASAPEVHERFLRRESLWPRLLFASDLPFGLITGVERWSETHGAIFVSRDHYPWSDPAMEAQFAEERRRLTYNVYHCIKALKEAVERLGISGAQAERLKEDIFSRNALSGVLGQPEQKGAAA